jgi:hypothetical protein
MTLHVIDSVADQNAVVPKLVRYGILRRIAFFYLFVTASCTEGERKHLSATNQCRFKEQVGLKIPGQIGFDLCMHGSMKVTTMHIRKITHRAYCDSPSWIIKPKVCKANGVRL